MLLGDGKKKKKNQFEKRMKKIREKEYLKSKVQNNDGHCARLTSILLIRGMATSLEYPL